MSESVLRDRDLPKWWWQVKLEVPITIWMPRGLYRAIKPLLVRYGVTIKRAGMRW